MMDYSLFAQQNLSSKYNYEPIDNLHKWQETKAKEKTKESSKRRYEVNWGHFQASFIL